MGRFRSPSGATGRRSWSARWLRRVLPPVLVVGALVPWVRAAADTSLVLPASPNRPLVVRRVRVQPGLRIVTADLTMENLETVDLIWCELWADNVEQGGGLGPFHRLDRDAVLIGAYSTEDAVGVLHLEATVKSVVRFNVRVLCGHQGNGSAAVLQPGASLEVVDALSSALVKGGVANPARKTPVTAAPAPATTVAKKKATTASPSTTVAKKKATTASPSTTVAKKKATTASPSTTVVKKKATTASPSTTVVKKKSSVTTRP